jgi:hypothetical protein
MCFQKGENTFGRGHKSKGISIFLNKIVTQTPPPPPVVIGFTVVISTRGTRLSPTSLCIWPPKPMWIKFRLDTL